MADVRMCEVPLDFLVSLTKECKHGHRWKHKESFIRSQEKTAGQVSCQIPAAAQKREEGEKEKRQAWRPDT